MKSLLLTAAAAALMTDLTAQAKLPAPVMDEAAQAKAAEAKAKAAHASKVGAYQLCAVQNRLAAKYGTAPQGIDPAACVNPGPFAGLAAEQKPAEAAGAHSPPATAVSPPSTKLPAAAKGP